MILEDVTLVDSDGDVDDDDNDDNEDSHSGFDGFQSSKRRSRCSTRMVTAPSPPKNWAR